MLPSVSVLVAVKDGTHRDGELHDHLVQLFAQLRADSCGECDRVGALRIVEVVQVTPIVRRSPLCRTLAQVLTEHGLFADAWRSHGKQVVAVVANPDAETQSVEGTLLTHDPTFAREGRCIARGLEGDLFGTEQRPTRS